MLSLATHLSDYSPFIEARFGHKVRCSLIGLGVVLVSLAISGEAEAKRGSQLGSLRGSSQSLDRQQRAARHSRLKLHHSGREVLRSVRAHKLVTVTPNRYLQLANVSYPYAHPDLKQLISTLSRLYWRSCRAPLVVTSLTRPKREQPRNASHRSVHPAGIAVDLRVPPSECRKWLRDTLSSWERAGLIEATREKRPPHFHVVAFPHKINTQRLAQLRGGSQSSKTKKGSQRRVAKRRAAKRHAAKGSRKLRRYKVKRGDSLWKLSRRWRVSQASIKKVNRLRSSRIDYGQVLLIPRHRG